MTALEILDEKTFLGSENSLNLFCCTKKPLNRLEQEMEEEKMQEEEEEEKGGGDVCVICGGGGGGGVVCGEGRRRIGRE